MTKCIKNIFSVSEWVGPKYPRREIILSFQQHLKKISVTCFNGQTLRALDFSNSEHTMVTLYFITDKIAIILHTRHNYDLVSNVKIV